MKSNRNPPEVIEEGGKKHFYGNLKGERKIEGI